MRGLKALAWSIVGATAALTLWLARTTGGQVDLGNFLFWAGLLAAVELLPVSLGFGAEVTMGFPIHLAIAIIYRSNPWVAMLIAGIAALNMREMRRQIPLRTALHNRAQIMLSVGAASGVFYIFSHAALNPAVVAAGALAHLAVNLGLVSAYTSVDKGLPFWTFLKELPPRPIEGFFLSYALLTGLGAVTAVVSSTVGLWAVAAILIPLVFARLSILGARAQQEMSEKLRRQQQALLEASERVFQEREKERKRIAEDIHDSSLQMLAAAAYGCGNAGDFLSAGQSGRAGAAIAAAREAIEGALERLRESITHLRGSWVERGGLMETIQGLAEQASTLWGVDIDIEGGVRAEPPASVSLAAYQILQEGLTNALKHSQSGSIRVRIAEQDGMVHIVVEDRGRGFDPESEVTEEHVGMRLMRERAERVGGRIEVASRPGAGTRLTAVLPGGLTR